MIDFKKLMDPAEQAKAREARAAEDLALQSKLESQRSQLRAVMPHLESLPEQERSFLRSCERSLAMALSISKKQAKWLDSIHTRLHPQRIAVPRQRT